MCNVGIEGVKYRFYTTSLPNLISSPNFCVRKTIYTHTFKMVHRKKNKQINKKPTQENYAWINDFWLTKSD